MVLRCWTRQHVPGKLAASDEQVSPGLGALLVAILVAKATAAICAHLPCFLHSIATANNEQRAGLAYVTLYGFHSNHTNHFARGCRYDRYLSTCRPLQAQKCGIQFCFNVIAATACISLAYCLPRCVVTVVACIRQLRTGREFDASPSLCCGCTD